MWFIKNIRFISGLSIHTRLADGPTTTNSSGSREISNYRDFPFWNPIPEAIVLAYCDGRTLIRSKVHSRTDRGWDLAWH